ncbi:Detected protein of unknown function [Hibiscus syriacus]|uniref:Myb-like domain-containing protein n=1 Tax=Hibiscus syriacus TaxID=106335 RepID=A0A6A2ZBE5_HIBSY|nr:Detected protein of unknown function [Hibiscus syriacus]
MAQLHSFPEKQSWGTWEELLLACAVHRYGSDSWGSVAMELQKRTSTLQPLSFTPLSCQHKFEDLKRRFAVNGGDDKNTDNIFTAAVPWLDELRKLRVAELRRQVQQYDLSIISLQLKVQKLKEEREHRLIENGKETGKSDLKREKESEKMGEDNEPDNKIRRQIHGRKETDRENHSLNESNFTVPKEKSPGTGPEEVKFRPDEYEMAKVVQSMKPAGGDSCNGSSSSVAKESAENSGRVDLREIGESESDTLLLILVDLGILLDLETWIALLVLSYAANDGAFELSGVELEDNILDLSYAANDITLLALSYAVNDVPSKLSVIKLKGLWQIALLDLSYATNDSNSKAFGGHDSLRREVETVDGPFVVKLSLELDILVVKFKSKYLCCFEANILRREVEIDSETIKLFVDSQPPLRCEVELVLSRV